MPGPDGILDSLRQEQQSLLEEWLECEPIPAVLKKIQLPPPDGFGIVTHATTLRRFRARKQLERVAEELDLARAHAEPTGASQDIFLKAAERLLATKAFQALSKPEFSAAHFSAAAQWLLRHRELEIRRQELELRRQRLERQFTRDQFNAAVRQARSPTAYQEEIIAEARRELYNSNP